METEDVKRVKELDVIKLSMSTDGTKQAPQGRASAITDGSDPASTQAAVNAVLVVLENLGFLATS